jgi:hypothetical protein
MLTIAEYAVLKAIAEGEDVKDAADISIIDSLRARDYVAMHYAITDYGRDALDQAESERMKG